jgi:small-conductance mechanosensitive channel
MTPDLWKEIGDILNELLGRLLNWTKASIDDYAPLLMNALLVLGVGIITATLARKVTAKVLRAAGFDLVLARMGVRRYLEARDIKTPPSRIVALVFYAVVLLLTLIMVLETLKFATAVLFVSRFVEWLPRLVGAIAIMIIGWFLAKWLGRIAARLSRLADFPLYQWVGFLVQSGVFVIALMLAFEIAGIASAPVLIGFVGIVTVGILLGLGLFTLCAKELMMNLLSRRFVRAEFKIGEHVQLEDRDGVIESFAPTAIRLREAPNRLTMVPNSRLMLETVSRMP